MVRSSFFNSVGGDRIYDAPIFAEYFASFIGNGVFPNPSTSLQVLQATNLQTNVAAGRGWINGYYVNNTSNYVLQHDIADGVLDRIDRVVFGLNLSTREITIYIKRGTPSASPVAPTLVRSGTLHELALADVRINRGALVISQSNITDTRLNNSLCGYVTGLVQQVDTTTLFNQYQSFYNNFVITSGQRVDDLIASGDQRFQTWENEARSEFEIWYAGVRDLLDGDVAVNLANRITEVDNKIGDLNNLTTTNKNNVVDAINENKAAIVDLINNGLGNVTKVWSGVDTSAAGINAKRATIDGYVDVIGAKVLITFANAPTSNVTLFINGGVALPVTANGRQLGARSFGNGATLLLERTDNSWRLATTESSFINSLPQNAYDVNVLPNLYPYGIFNNVVNTAAIVSGFSVSATGQSAANNVKMELMVSRVSNVNAAGDNVKQRITFIDNNLVSGNTRNGTIIGIYERCSVSSGSALTGWGNWATIYNEANAARAAMQNFSLSLNEDKDGLLLTY